MKLEINARGIAALWLRGHAPTSAEADIESLAALMDGIWADGVKKGLEISLDTLRSSPTPSAAEATLEAEKAVLIQEYKAKEA